MSTPAEILEFWFGPKRNSHEYAPETIERWFKKDDAFDDELRRTFATDVERALNQQYKEWEDQPETALALILLLDQFTRNIFRNLPKSFQGDERAFKVAMQSISLQWDSLYSPIERAFFYLPLMHSENLETQDQCVSLYKSLYELHRDEPWGDMLKMNLSYAEKHRDIIRRFGRFPHRNWILGRHSTSEEVEFLKTPGSSF